MNIPSDPRAIGLPSKYTYWFPHQREAIEYILNSDKKVVFLEMPTGAGKTLVSKGLFNASKMQGSIITNNTDLQHQFVKDFPDVSLLKGRSHFICDIDNSVTAAEAACTVGFQCPFKHTDQCAYYKQILDARPAQTTIENYPFFLNHQVYSEDKRQIELLVCDEGHHLGDQLKNFASFSISDREVNDCGVEAVPDSINPFDWIVWAKKVERELSVYVEDAKTTINQKPDSGHFWQDQLVPSLLEVQKYKKYLLLYRKIQLLLQYSSGKAEDWFLQRSQRLGRTEFRLIEAKELFSILDNITSQKIVIMSATLGDIDHAATQLNVSKYDKYVAPDVYKPENRPIYYVTGLGRFTRSSDPDMARFRRSVSAIDDILEKHAGEKGIVHTASHERAKIVLLGSRNRSRLVGHEPTVSISRSEAITEFKDSTEDKVLVSPSILEGLDLPEEQCRFIIFAKAPFEDLSNPLVKEELDREGWKGVLHRLIIKTKQGIGRGIRSQADFCSIYLLDESFDKVLLNAADDEVFKYIQTIEVN